MATNKTVWLSTKSLERVWSWAIKNEHTPLGEAYMAACAAVGARDCRKIADQLRPTWKRKRGKYGYISEAYKLYEMPYTYRDTVGRIILDMLKREEMK